MPRPPLHDAVFLVSAPHAAEGRWWFEVTGKEQKSYGPFESGAAAARERDALFQRWRRSANARGGWAWKSTAERWVVTLPLSVDIAGLPLDSPPCSRHDPAWWRGEEDGGA